MFANPEVPHKKTASRKKGTKTIMIRIRLFSAFPEFSMISRSHVTFNNTLDCDHFEVQ